MSEYTQSQLNKNRDDKFQMVFNVPEILKKINTSNLSSRSKNIINENSFQFSIFGTVVPTIAVPEVVAGYGGQNYKLSSHSRLPYENITVDFTVDNMFNNWWVIYKWLDILNDDSESTYDSGELSSKTEPRLYQTDFIVYGLDEFEKKVMKFTYTKAFPVSLGNIVYNYQNSKETACQLTFSFSQFKAEPI